ncbi:OTU domain-containing protein 6B [Chytridiales sp. JEL 0842]|nr:OTU domain-containing protein 6B [Chytridiales sp. JEL 0842]
METTEEELLLRHRKEVKELTGKITGLKKQVSKGAGDKKKKQEVNEQIARMEHELSKRHEEELLAFRASKLAVSDVIAPETTAEEEPVNGDASTSSTTTDEPKEQKKKPNRQQARKAKKAAQMEEMRKQAEEEAAGSVDMRKVEDEAIDALIKPLNLRIKQITPDGHCLFNALCDQLQLADDTLSFSYTHLRKLAAEYMRSHPDDFMPFLVDDNGDMLTEDKFQKYCDDMANTAVWGGQLEIQALSMHLKREIHVIQAGSPVVKVGEHFKSDKPLLISYHRHHFGLGEHYNSLIPSA